jgi:hypothetical protein
VTQGLLAATQAVFLIAIVRAAIPRLGPDPRPKNAGDVMDFVSPILSVGFQGAMWIGAMVLLAGLLAAGLAIERRFGPVAQALFALGAPLLLLGMVMSRPIAPHALAAQAGDAIRVFLRGGPLSVREGLPTAQQDRFDETVTSPLNLPRLLIGPHPDLLPLLEAVQAGPTTQRARRELVTVALVHLDIGLRPGALEVRGTLLGPSLDQRTDPVLREAVFRSFYEEGELHLPGLLFDAVAAGLLEAEAARWIDEEIPDAGGFLAFAYVFPAGEDGFARAWASLGTSSDPSRVISSGLHWWSAFDGPSPWNRPWESDADLGALGAALQVLRNHRRPGPRKLGEVHLQQLLEAQGERAGAEALLDP